MMRLPSQINLQSLDINPAEIKQVVILRSTPTHLVCRLAFNHCSYILKWFYSCNSVEVQTYELLEKYGIDTLPVHKRTKQALLVEDIQFSSSWRLATQKDMEYGATGEAVAKWYRNLHRVGQEALKDPNCPSFFLSHWVSQITQSSLMKAGTVFEFQNKPGWQKVFEHLEWLKAKYLSFPQTFNYGDFAAENLVLLKTGDSPQRAIIFDYDCFTLGVAYSDWRNVMYSLGGAAQTWFREVYGSINEMEMVLDEPLSVLFGLIVASQRSRIPKWVVPLVDKVKSGVLEQSINKALVT